MDALYKISYGLYVASAHENGRDNACIIDAFMQVTNVAPIICTANINKDNATHDMIKNTKKFNISVLTASAPFEDIFSRFGFQSGRDVDKFDGFHSTRRSKNGLLYLTDHTNACMSFDVTGVVDFGTHTMFSAVLTDSAVLSDADSVTYSYYQKNIKPLPQDGGFVCDICGYVYRDAELPADYICPLCKASATNFSQQKGD
ncbi:MAG: flavin reductase [Defluviitaleaceae bacterium]|nr:flavin reductase [Defluviitaleaceae bacterium]